MSAEAGAPGALYRRGYDAGHSEAASELAELRTENQELRAALNEFVDAQWMQDAYRLEARCPPLSVPTMDELLGLGIADDEAREYIEDFDEQAAIAEHAKRIRYTAAYNEAIAVLSKYEKAADTAGQSAAEAADIINRTGA